MTSLWLGQELNIPYRYGAITLTCPARPEHKVMIQGELKEIFFETTSKQIHYFMKSMNNFIHEVD